MEVCSGEEVKDPVFWNKESLEKNWNEAAKEYCIARDEFNAAQDRKIKAKDALLRARTQYNNFINEQHGLGKEMDLDDE